MQHAWITFNREKNPERALLKIMIIYFHHRITVTCTSERMLLLTYYGARNQEDSNL
jgi:hypothetical protein